MEKLKTVLKTASGAFALIPGLTVLATNIGVPPNCSKVVFFAVIESFGVFTLLILQLNQERFKLLSLKRINQLSLSSIFMFAVALFSYLFIFNQNVVSVQYSDSLFFPFWPQGELLKGLQTFGSKVELIHNWGRDDVYTTIQTSSATVLTITTLIFLFVYQLIFITLTFAFGLLALRVGELKHQDVPIQNGM